MKNYLRKSIFFAIALLICLIVVLVSSVKWDALIQTLFNSSSIDEPAGTPPSFVSMDQIQVHFIDVGQADSIYIKLPDNIDILIDGGNIDDGETVVNYLSEQWVDDIELIIATHPHEDHIGGLPAVLKAFQVEEIIDSGKTENSDVYRTYATAAQAERCTWSADNYQKFTWGDISLHIYTGGETWNNLNDYSVVCRLDTGDIGFLFMGDAGTPVEKILHGELKSEILKVGDHGCSSSSDPTFLSKVLPAIAVINAGAGNPRGCPLQDTLDKLQAVGASVYSTDLSGTVVVSTEGQSYSVGSESSGSEAALAIPPLDN